MSEFYKWAAFILISLVNLPAGASTVLTGDTWAVTGDDGTYTWDESTLVFTSQTPISSSADFDIEGYFDWVGSGGQSGRELFRGTHFADETLRFSGYQIIDRVGIILGNYAALVQPDGNKIVGDWDSGTVPGTGIPGDFVAVRNTAVPVPAAVWLFGSGLIGLTGIARKKSA